MCGDCVEVILTMPVEMHDIQTLTLKDTQLTMVKSVDGLFMVPFPHSLNSHSVIILFYVLRCMFILQHLDFGIVLSRISTYRSSC